jgi:hypothetical protein
MTTEAEASPTAENEALLTSDPWLNRVEALERELTSFKRASSRGRVVRLVLLLAVIALIGGTIWAFYKLGRDITSEKNLNLLADRAKARLDQSADPARKQLQLLVDNCRPVLTEAFNQRAETDLPRYTEAFNAERDVLVANLQTRLKDKITSHYQQSEKKYQAILQEEFPELKDPDLVIKTYAALQQILEKFVEKFYSEQLQQEFDRFSANWERLPLAPIPAEGEPTLEQQLIAELLRLASLIVEEKVEFQTSL